MNQQHFAGYINVANLFCKEYYLIFRNTGTWGESGAFIVSNFEEIILPIIELNENFIRGHREMRKPGQSVL